jgi:hypothetical protein
MATPNDNTEVPTEGLNVNHAEVPEEDPAEESPQIPVGTVLLEVTSILTSFEFDEVNLGPAFPPRNGYGTRGTPVSLYAVRKPRKKKNKNKVKVTIQDAPSKEPETKPPPPDGDGAGAAGGVTVF